MITASKLSKAIDGVKVLDDVSLDIDPGEILVIMGPSGSGKSTLLRNIALIDSPDSGSVHIDGKQYDFPQAHDPLSSIYRSELYPKMTLVFQQFFLWPHLTVSENIHLALRGSKSINKEKLSEICRFFDIKDILNKYPNEISVGQKQKVSLARAIVLKPKYLFLDEVTSALDIESTLQMLSYLKKLTDENVAIVFVTHALHIAQKIADKVAFVEDGKIVEYGEREILFKPKTDRFKKFIATPIYT